MTWWKRPALNSKTSGIIEALIIRDVLSDDVITQAGNARSIFQTQAFRSLVREETKHWHVAWMRSRQQTKLRIPCEGREPVLLTELVSHFKGPAFRVGSIGDWRRCIRRCAGLWIACGGSWVNYEPCDWSRCGALSHGEWVRTYRER